MTDTFTLWSEMKCYAQRYALTSRPLPWDVECELWLHNLLDSRLPYERDRDEAFEYYAGEMRAMIHDLRLQAAVEPRRSVVRLTLRKSCVRLITAIDTYPNYEDDLAEPALEALAALQNIIAQAPHDENGIALFRDDLRDALKRFVGDVGETWAAGDPIFDAYADLTKCLEGTTEI